MKIEGLDGVHQGRLVAHLKNKQCLSARGLAAPMWCFGFDTLRLGLQKINHPEAEARYMRGLANSIGGELIALKRYEEGVDNYFRDSDVPSDVADAYNKIYKRPVSTMSHQFFHFKSVYVMRYKGVLVWFLNHQRAEHQTIELYGLSQPHHNKGAIKWEFLNKLMEILPSYKKPKLLGYDFAIDSQIDLEWIVKEIAFPFVAEKLNKARGKSKYDITYHDDNEESGTVYLQPKKKNKRADRIIIYDKERKHGLNYPLVRFEITKICNVKLNTLVVLNEIAKIELSELCITTERVPIDDVAIEE